MLSALASLVGLPSPTALAIHFAVWLGITGGAFWFGWHEKSIRDQADLTQALQFAQLQTIQAAQISSDVSVAVQSQIASLNEISMTLIQEVPRYVTQKADSECVITRGFVELWNAAVNSVSPVSSASVDEPDPSIRPSAIVANAIANFRKCNAYRTEDLGWRDWYAKEAAIK